MSRSRSVAFLIAAILYVLLPTDLAPDFLPLVGWIDDLLVLAAGLYLFWTQLRSGPPDPGTTGKVLDAEEVPQPPSPPPDDGAFRG